MPTGAPTQELSLLENPHEANTVPGEGKGKRQPQGSLGDRELCHLRLGHAQATRRLLASSRSVGGRS